MDANYISTLKIQLLREQNFFANLLMMMEIKAKEDMEFPAATNGDTIFLKPSMIDKYTSSNVKAILCHEALHPAFLYWERGRGRNAMLWNIASDLPINEEVSKYYQFPEGVLMPPEKYKGQCSEYIYNDLLQSMEKNQKLCNAYDKSVKDDHMERDKGRWGTDKEMSNKWKQRVETAMEMSRQQGNLPESIEKLFGQTYKMKTDLFEILRQFVTDADGVDQTWFPADRRMLACTDQVWPTDFGEYLEIAVGMDTSGSIYPELQAKFAHATKKMCSQFTDYLLHFMSCDADVHQDLKLTPFTKWPEKFLGGGGTDFRPVFDRLKKSKVHPRCLIYFTDLYGEFPSKAPEYPVLWVISEKTDVQPPFGRMVKIDFSDPESLK